MPSNYEGLRLFLSSPGDVARERAIAETIVRQVDSTCKDRLGLSLDCVRWETFEPRTHLSPTNQEWLLEQLTGCDGFILILGKRIGQREPGETRTRTETEIGLALRLLA